MKEMVIAAKTDSNIRLKLVMSFEPLIKKCIKVYIKDFYYYEDAMQEGYLTVLKCIERYDVNSKSEFPGYVKMAMNHNIRDFSKKIKSDVSLDEEITEHGGTLLDVLESEVNIERDKIREEEIGELYRGLKKLTNKQREIIDEVYFKNLSMMEVCKNRRCHYMAVVRLKDRAIESLRKDIVGTAEI